MANKLTGIDRASNRKSPAAGKRQGAGYRSALRRGLAVGLALSAGLLITLPVSADNFLDNLELSLESQRIVDLTSELPTLSGSFLAALSAGANGDDAEAIENYRRAITLDPENNNLKQSLFLALTSNGEIGEAIELLKSIPAESQTENVNHVVIAVNALKQKSWAQAIARIDRVTGADLDNMLATVFGAWAMYGDRKIDDAMARLDGLSGPDWIEMVKEFHAGSMLSAAGKDAEAIPRFRKAIEYRAVASALTETFLHAIEGLARSQARTGDRDGAKKTVEEGLGLLNGHPPLAQLESELTNEAVNIAPLIGSAQAGGAEIFFNVGTAISRQGGLPFAQGHLQLARHLVPQNAAIQYAIANVYEEQDRYEQANHYYGAIGAESPYYRRAQLEVALNLNRMKQVPDSVATLTRLIGEDPSDLIAILSLGGVHAQHEEFEKAIEVYTAAIERIGTPEERHWNLFYRRGIGYERTKQWPKAEDDFKAALKLQPNQPDVLNYLGYSWIDQGVNLEEGIEMVRKAVELRPNSGFIIDSLGWAYFRLGRYEEAVAELERALELMPSDPVVNDHLGDAYWHTGRRLEAVFQWKHALANEPAEEDRIKIERKLQEGLTN